MILLKFPFLLTIGPVLTFIDEGLTNSEDKNKIHVELSCERKCTIERRKSRLKKLYTYLFT